MAKTKDLATGRPTQATRTTLSADRRDTLRPADSLRLSRRFSTDASLKVAERVTTEMGGLLDSKSEELVRLMEVAEETSRKVVATELDLRREQEMHERLEAELGRLEHEVTEARAENHALSAKKEALSEEVHKLRKQSDVLSRDNDKLSGDADALGKEVKELQAEAATLESRRAKLAEDIARLKKLRQEYLGNINKLKADKDDLVS